MNSESLLRILIKEMNHARDSLPEYGSQKHLEELDRILDDIKNLKQTLKKGPNRHKNRKEVNQLQSAVQALRFLRRRASYRGTKEMDILLSTFVNKYIDSFDETLLSELETFLNFEDEIILNYYNYNIIKKKIDENKVARIFKKFKI